MTRKKYHVYRKQIKEKDREKFISFYDIEAKEDLIYDFIIRLPEMWQKLNAIAIAEKRGFIDTLIKLVDDKHKKIVNEKHGINKAIRSKGLA